MTIEDAFSLFRTASAARSLTDVTEHEHPEAFGSRYVEVSDQSGVLRLIFDGKDGILTLEINHGPTDDPARLWLDLYQSSCKDGKLLVAEQEEVSLESAIDYGLNLMKPAQDANAA